MTSPHKPTDEQQAIIDAVAQTQSNLMISAYAGTAKSTTLEMAAPGVKGPALALAFNKKIATELQSRLPDNFKAQTLNSIGHGAWIRALNRPTIKLDGQKLGKLVTAIAKDHKAQLLDWQWDCVRQATSDAMKAGISPNDQGSPLLADTPENWRDVIEVPTSDDFEFIYKLAHAVLQANVGTARAGQISFDDQIYCPTILGGAWPRYPTTFVDESQDLSPLNHQMLTLTSTGRIVAVGDPRQAIYLFRGADANSMKNMRTIRPQWTDLSLTMTFRCPKAIVARQQDHAPGFTAHSSNATGQFLHLPHTDEANEGYDHKSLLKVASDINANFIAIVCRNNAPLVNMAFKLIRSGVGCQMLGRDIGTGLIRLVSRLEKSDATPILKFSETLTKWLDTECALAQANNKPERSDKLTDQAECLRATIEGSSPTTVGELKLILTRIFSRESGSIILSSVHRAKGLEWPVVLHLDPWRIPSKQAKMAAQSGDYSHLEQEYNLRYVCETRTKHTLIAADMRDYGTNGANGANS